MSDADLTAPDPLRARVAHLESAVAALGARLAMLEGVAWAGTGPTRSALAEALAADRLGAVEPVALAAGQPNEAGETAAAGDPDETFDESELPAVAPAAPARDWERLIGGRWALWVGAAAVFCAVAFFLAQAWQAMAPALKVGGGAALGAGLLVGAFAARRRTESWFPEGLAGAGLGLFYLDIWAAFHQYGMISAGASFTCLAIVTAAGAVLAVRLDALSLAALAMAGGFFTPLLLGGGGQAGLLPPAYAAVIDAGLLGVSLYRRWPALAWGCLFGTACLWLAGQPDDAPGAALAVLTLLFGLFTATAVGHGLRKGERTDPHDVLLLLIATFAYAPTGYPLWGQLLPDAKVAFPLGLGALFAATAFWLRARLPANGPLRAGAEALAVFAFTLAVPVALGQDATAITWSVEAALLAALAMRFELALYRWLGSVVGGLGAVVTSAWSFSKLPVWQVPAVNERALPMVVAMLCGVGLVAWAHRLGRPTGRGALLVAVAGATSWVSMDAHLLADLHALGLPSQAWPRAAEGLLALMAGAAFVTGVRWPDGRLRGAAFLWWAGVAAAVVLTDPFATAAAGLDWRPFATLGAIAAGLAITAAGLRLPAEHAGATGPVLIARVGLATVLLTVWGLSVEVHAAVAPTWPHAGQLGISLVWIVSGVACLLGGLGRAVKALRLLGLGLMGASVCKVFFFDLAFLETGPRIVSFAGLGVALIGISLLYSRERK